MILDVNEICSKIDSDLVTFIHNIINVIKLGVPIALVIFGMIDLGKGVVANKEDEIKKGQGVFIKRLIAGVIVFFIISITQFTMSIIDKESDGEIWNCANQILNGSITGENNTNKPRKTKDTKAIVKECCSEISGEYIEEEESAHCKFETGAQSEKYYKCYTERLDK